MSETNRIEYKRELTSELDIEKEVVAFLNYKEGGYIYIGIDKDGSIVGVSNVGLYAEVERPHKAQHLSFGYGTV